MADLPRDRAPEVRAWDADRNAVVARLHLALGEGRLNPDEFAQRAEAASEAVTTAELDALVADQPAGASPAPEIVGARAAEAPISSVFGDVEVIVAEGVDAELHGWTVFGDRRVELAPGPRLAGTPLVVVHARTVFGDLRLRSLAPGQSPSRWRALLDRLAQWPPPPPPVPPAPPKL